MDESPYLIASDGLIACAKEWQMAKRKHHYLRNYCGITTKSMHRKWRLVCLDVMSGPGRCKLKETGEEFAGSPFVALEHEFAEYHFIEEHEGLAQALEQRVSQHPKAKNVIIHNESWVDLVSSGKLQFDNSTLVVAFIDPTGISQVPMSAMRQLARNPHIDMLRHGHNQSAPEKLPFVERLRALWLRGGSGDQGWPALWLVEIDAVAG